MTHFNDRFFATGAPLDFADTSFLHHFLRHRRGTLNLRAQRWLGHDATAEALNLTLRLLMDPQGPAGRWWTTSSDADHARMILRQVCVALSSGYDTPERAELHAHPDMFGRLTEGFGIIDTRADPRRNGPHFGWSYDRDTRTLSWRDTDRRVSYSLKSGRVHDARVAWSAPHRASPDQLLKLHFGDAARFADAHRRGTGDHEARAEGCIDWWGEALTQAFEDIGDETLDLLRPLRCGGWEVYRALLEMPALADLLRTDASLTVGLVHVLLFAHEEGKSDGRLPDSAALVGRPRREIARHLGFPDTESVVRILRRLEAGCCTLDNLSRLSEMLGPPDPLLSGEERRAHLLRARRLRHLPRLNDAVLTALEEDPGGRLFSFCALEEMGRCVGLDTSGNLVRRVLRAQPPEQPRRPWRRIDCLEEFEAMRTRVEPPIKRLTTPWRFQPWVDPPLAGNERIKPLRTREELFEQGLDASNCLRNDEELSRMFRGVASGRAYVYKVAGPDDATLELRRSDDGERWAIGQLMFAGNEPADEETWRFVEEWLRDGSRRKAGGRKRAVGDEADGEEAEAV